MFLDFYNVTLFKGYVFANEVARLHPPCIRYHFLNSISNIVLPTFLSRPDLDVGMPVCLAKFCLTFVRPNARFHENVKPGMPVPFDLFAILIKFIIVLISIDN